MVHVALRVVDADRVEQLVHPGHAEGADVEHLGVAALEERRAVRGREQADLGGERSDVGRAAAVDADALFDDALADDLLRVRADRRLDLTLALGELGRRARRRCSSVASSRAALRSDLVVMALAACRRSAPTATTRS